MSKIEVTTRMDSVEIEGVQSIRMEEIRNEGASGYRRSLIITTDMGDFRLTVRAMAEAPLGVKVPARITL